MLLYSAYIIIVKEQLYKIVVIKSHCHRISTCKSTPPPPFPQIRSNISMLETFWQQNTGDGSHKESLHTAAFPFLQFLQSQTAKIKPPSCFHWMSYFMYCHTAHFKKTYNTQKVLRQKKGKNTLESQSGFF